MIKPEIYHFFQYVYPEYISFKGDILKNKILIFKRAPLLGKSESSFIKYCLYHVFFIFIFILKQIENLFFGKSEYYKNNTQGKNLFARALWSTLVLCGLYLIIKRKLPDCNIDYKEFAAFVAIFLGLYWNARSVFTKKWDYAANMFNKLCFDLPLRSYKNKIIKLISINFFQVTFALDLLLLEVWSHKSFRHAFMESLELAIVYKNFKSNYEIGQGLDVDLILRGSKIDLKQLKENCWNNFEDISELLSELQADLSDFVINNNDY